MLHRRSVLDADWAGETVFIIAGGPSVAQQNLELLRGRKIIAINSSYERLEGYGVPGFTDKPPHLPHVDLLIFGDGHWWTAHKQKAGRLDCPIVTVAQNVKDERVTKLTQLRPPAFSHAPTALTQRATTLSAAINAAALKAPGGRIVIIGADGQFGEGGQRNHHSPHNRRHKDGCWDRHHDDLQKIVAPLTALGIPVINASPGSAWADLWPVMSLSEAIDYVDNKRAFPVLPVAPVAKPPLVVSSMLGMGDCLHERAILREMMKTNELWLEAHNAAMFHDLAAEGLQIVLRTRNATPGGRYRRALSGRIRESAPVTATKPVPAPGRAVRKKITYDSKQTMRFNSVLAAMFNSVGMKLPDRPDFSMPVPDAWRERARRMLARFNMGGKPLMVYRPIIQNNFWACPARSPDPAAYDALYRSIRDQFFVVAVANLGKDGEVIHGPKPEVDADFTHGECDFETLAALFAEAALVFGNAGFTPILSQAVGTPNICVYGANESFRETNRGGAHLAPTLPIEPDKPCTCHARFCKCDKTITLPPAIEKVKAFAAEHGAGKAVAVASEPAPRVLVFGTTYADTPERTALTNHWIRLHKALNPECDFLLVDSCSPLALPQGVEVWSFPDNIGHLSRNGPDGPSSKGQDGWGRAFCKGLQTAIDKGHDYVAHIEGDSLFGLPLAPVIDEMRARGLDAVSVPVKGTKRDEVGWVETGLMIFRTAFLVETDFIAKYDWPSRKAYPKTPEKVIFEMLGDRLTMMPWQALRGDKNQITVETVGELDWVTHCHGQPQIYDRFVAEVLGEEVEKPKSAPGELLKVNVGCGRNILKGWKNHDQDVDITKPLPFANDSVDFMLAEHVIEHVGYYEALGFLKECARVLKPWGVIRVCVPSIERVLKHGDENYIKFVSRWAPTPDVRGAMHAILFEHGHKAPWTESLMEATLHYCGFKNITRCEPSQSRHEMLKNIDGHPKSIGPRNNWIETVIFEAEAEK